MNTLVFENGQMSHGGSLAISTYNTDQKSIVNAFESQFTKLEKDASYLFFVENVQFKGSSIAGS